ncbi:MAG: hypothetical protein WBN79_07170 [Gemmatimonadota bacterium]
MSRLHMSSPALVWAASLYLGGAGEQRSLEEGGNTLRQLMLKPAALFQEYWPWVAGGVVVILLLRWYLRK